MEHANMSLILFLRTRANFFQISGFVYAQHVRCVLAVVSVRSNPGQEALHRLGYTLDEPLEYFKEKHSLNRIAKHCYEY